MKLVVNGMAIPVFASGDSAKIFEADNCFHEQLHLSVGARRQRGPPRGPSSGSGLADVEQHLFGTVAPREVTESRGSGRERVRLRSRQL